MSFLEKNGMIEQKACRIGVKAAWVRRKRMQDFEFYTPTRMIFGKDTQKQVGKIVKE